jgi:hypothetical protein
MKDREPENSEWENRPENEPLPKARFDMGQIVVTTGADITLAQLERHPVQLLARHVEGDWGDLVEQDRKLNEQALNPDFPTRLFSRYEIDDEIFYVISEWDRSITTVLRSDEY